MVATSHKLHLRTSSVSSAEEPQDPVLTRMTLSHRQATWLRNVTVLLFAASGLGMAWYCLFGTHNHARQRLFFRGPTVDPVVVFNHTVVEHDTCDGDEIARRAFNGFWVKKPNEQEPAYGGTCRFAHPDYLCDGAKTSANAFSFIVKAPSSTCRVTSPLGSVRTLQRQNREALLCGGKQMEQMYLAAMCLLEQYLVSVDYVSVSSSTIKTFRKSHVGGGGTGDDRENDFPTCTCSNRPGDCCYTAKGRGVTCATFKVVTELANTFSLCLASIDEMKAGQASGECAGAAMHRHRRKIRRGQATQRHPFHVLAADQSIDFGVLDGNLEELRFPGKVIHLTTPRGFGYQTTVSQLFQNKDPIKVAQHQVKRKVLAENSHRERGNVVAIDFTSMVAARKGDAYAAKFPVLGKTSAGATKQCCESQDAENAQRCNCEDFVLQIPCRNRRANGSSSCEPSKNMCMPGPVDEMTRFLLAAMTSPLESSV